MNHEVTTSEINELIATVSRLAFQSGVRSERQKNVKILKELPAEFSHNGYSLRTVKTAIKRIEEKDANASKTIN